MFEKCVLTILELNWNQRLGHKKTKLNICHHMFTSSTQLQNGSFHNVERTRTSTKCQKMKNARAKRAKVLFLIVKYANFVGFLLPSSSWLLKLPITVAYLFRMTTRTRNHLLKRSHLQNPQVVKKSGRKEKRKKEKKRKARKKIREKQVIYYSSD